jgi:chromosomal replication initiator protein
MATAPAFDWERLLGAVRDDAPTLYRAWFTTLRATQPQRGELEIRTDDLSQAHYLEDCCRNAFAHAAMKVTGHLLVVRFTCDHDAQRVLLAGGSGPTLTHIRLAPDYTFDQFVVGPSNRLAHAACVAVCNQPGTLYNPLFVHGATGLGKTHLLQATCAETLRQNHAVQAIYVTCETFVNDLVQAMTAGQIQAFRERARQADLFVIDDIQFLAKRESSQEELFHTFNVLHQSGKQIIFSADSPPGDIPTLEDRLISRFNWGLVLQLDPPSRETRQAILHKKARLRGVELPDEVVDVIAEQVEANIRLLEGALTKFITVTQIGGKPLNVETAREVLADFGGREQRPLRIAEILEAVSHHFGVRLQDLLSRKRSRSISHPRQIAMYLARKLTPLSLEEIGMHFGGRDHSTVLHAERTIESTRASDRELAHALSHLTSRLLARN